MALWEVSIQKQLGSEYWINVYHCEAADQPAARVVAEEIVGVERAVTMDNVSFVNFRIRQASVLGAPGTVYPIGLTGLVATTVYMPLFVVARFDFAVPVGRPSRKFLKPPVATTIISNGTFTTAGQTFYNNTYADGLLAISELRANDGQSFLSIRVNPTVGMRQLRRGSRKRTTPIIP